MNLKLFNSLMEQPPAQHPSEWWAFLEICRSYLRKHPIENPIVIELGVYENKQKRFYEQFLGAEHIGIDKRSKRCTPEIVGDTHSPGVLKALKEKLKGRPINILFIDASHWYESVKKDFEMYSPLCDGIIAFHDIDLGRHRGRRANRQVWRFWDELKAKKDKKFSFVSLNGGMGTGVMIRK